MDINRALCSLNRQGVESAILEPAWKGKRIVVSYFRWQRVAGENDAILDAYNWPHDLRAGYKSWGGIRPERLDILASLVVTKTKTIPVAYGVRAKADLPHNALLTRNLLVGHGFTTAIGWYRCVSTQDVIDADTLQRISNRFQLPVPLQWRVVEN